MTHLVQLLLDTLRNHRTFEVTGIPIFFTVLIGAILAVYQLRAQTRANRASVLMSIDQQSKDEGIRTARSIMRRIDREMRDFDRQHWQLDARSTAEIDSLRARARYLFAQKAVNHLHNGNDEQYSYIVDALGYLETIGLAIRRGYLNYQDAYLLWGGIILGAGEILEGHIKFRQDEENDLEIYEHFLWVLCSFRQYPASLRTPAQKLKSVVTKIAALQSRRRSRDTDLFTGPQN
ncbi:MAG: DUF4760 domain-containing protein [Blastocatellia bacterium]